LELVNKKAKEEEASVYRVSSIQILMPRETYLRLISMPLISIFHQKKENLLKALPKIQK
jgi:hypothetical protein